MAIQFQRTARKASLLAALVAAIATAALAHPQASHAAREGCWDSYADFYTTGTIKEVCYHGRYSDASNTYDYYYISAYDSLVSDFWGRRVWYYTNRWWSYCQHAPMGYWVNVDCRYF
jgi:hypothetical protein